MIVDGTSKLNMAKAAQLIKAGEVVAFPTETVYGLGADALNPRAIEKIFQIKQRPLADPLIVHVTDLEDIEKVAVPLPEKVQTMAMKLMERFWPGPLTLIFQSGAGLPENVTGGLKTVGLRMPNHIIARALIKNCGTPLAAPSANRFQSLSPTTAGAVERELGADIPVILDGGPCKVGVESTVLSLIDGPVILRPGGVSQEELEYVLGFKVPFLKEVMPGIPLPSPGLMEFHYAPRKPLKFFSREELEKFGKKRSNAQAVAGGALLCFSKKDKLLFSKLGFMESAILSEKGNLREAAAEFYSLLRKLDEGKSTSIFALNFPNENLGVALNDRLKKAQHGFKK
jgi:L-threonylcarbamoyladenylate synthase